MFFRLPDDNMLLLNVEVKTFEAFRVCLLLSVFSLMR